MNILDKKKVLSLLFAEKLSVSGKYSFLLEGFSVNPGCGNFDIARQIVPGSSPRELEPAIRIMFLRG